MYNRCLSAFMSMHCEHNTHRGQRRASDLSELELLYGCWESNPSLFREHHTLKHKLSLQLQEFSLEMICSGSDRVNTMLLVSQHSYTFVWRCSSFLKQHLKFIFEICFKTFLYSLACLIPLDIRLITDHIV